MNRSMVTIDGNEAAAYVAHKTNEVIAIYPITPSSPMGEWSDAWSTAGEKNIWGTVPVVTEMQSEGGAAGAVHGALQTGALTTTFTSSQGLMLMIPNMYKIAGELTPTVFHVAARSLAAQALSIFGDHSDVMAVRGTGFALLVSASIQEVMDFTLIAQAAALETRVPFMHFFDGFRTSHEVNKIEQLTEDDMRAMIDDELVRAHRARAMSPDHPVLRGSAQNPDVYFQGRETVNRFYLDCPAIVQKVMDKFAGLAGRQYKLFDYFGAPDAERVIVLMGSGAEAVQETVEYLTKRSKKVGVIKVRLYRPFSIEHFVQALPPTVKSITTLDRTKEPGSLGEPLYLDMVAAISETMANRSGSLKIFPRTIGGRYGLSSKEFTLAMNTIMQTCFFAISGVLPREEAIAAIKATIKKTYGAKGDEIVQMNYRAVDQTLENLHEVKVPDKVTSAFDRPALVSGQAPEFVKNFTAKIIAGYGDELPVSAMPVDGTFPTATARWEKRAIALEIPIWDKEICLAKNKRETRLKAINMKPLIEHRERERANFDFFLGIPALDRSKIKVNSVKGSQLLQPLFEFSGACLGCGETPYVKFMSQLFGDRAVIANATGCSSIYSGNLPTTPWAKNPEGRGSAWSNSLFEDNAEFGIGFRLTIDKQKEQAEELLRLLEAEIGTELAQSLLNPDQSDEAGIYEQRERVAKLKEKLEGMNSPAARNLLSLADYLVKKSVWIIGGDGWAYDIGYGGLDHVLASGKNVNILVLDTEVYSNTGGQMSKATPRGAVAKFAAGGKPRPKKDLAMLAMSYGNAYVARVAMGANDTQTVQAFIEAEQYDGPSLIIAYSHCIAHGINMIKGMEQQKLAVNSGYWPLFRYNPLLADEGKSPPERGFGLHLDSRAPAIPVKEYMYRETRFKMLTKSKPAEAERLLQLAQQDVQLRWRTYEHLAAFSATNGNGVPESTKVVE